MLSPAASPHTHPGACRVLETMSHTGLLNKMHQQDDTERTVSCDEEHKQGSPTVTIPRPFHFLSDDRAALHPLDADDESHQSEVPLARSLDYLKNELRKNEPSPQTPGNRGLTRPESPKLHHSKVANSSSVSSEVPLAQSLDFLRKGLRSSYFSPTKAHRQATPTRPESPKFHRMHTRESPKSSEQLESEMMEEFRKQPFKAKPAPFFHSPSDDCATQGSDRPLTEPQPFHFLTEERASSHLESPGPDFTPRAELDLLECTKKFHALPMPDFSHIVSEVSTPATQHVTVPQPFHFQIDERMMRFEGQTSVKSDSDDQYPPFRARPVPKSTYEVPPPHVGSVSPLESSPPKLATQARALKRQTVDEEFQRKAEDFHKKKEESLLRRKREKHLEAMQLASAQPVSASKSTLTAFHLQSVARHEDYQKQFSQKLAREDLKLVEQSNFRARPFVSYSSPLKKAHDGQRKLTEPKPFSLECVTRHDAFKRQRTLQLAKEDAERREQAEFKAKALPPATYGKNKVVSSENRGSTEKSPIGNPTADAMAMESAKGQSVNSVSNEPLATRLAHSLPCTSGSVSMVAALKVFAGLCVFRVLNTWIVQSYFDPDEFWQTMEPAYCEAFIGDRSCPGFTWEWKRRAPQSAVTLIERSMLGPARTFLSVVPTYLFFMTTKIFRIDSSWMVSRGPMILSAVSVAAPIDFAVWYTAQWLERGSIISTTLPAWCLFCSLSSWFNGYTLVRTYANCQENLLLVAAVALLSPELIANVDRKGRSLRGCIAFLLGGLSVAIRFTSLAAFVPIGVLLALREKGWAKARFLIFPCAVFGVAGIGTSMIVDRLFYGFWTIPFLGNFHFNVILDYADLYGSHPLHWYFSSGLPAVSGLLLPFVLYDFVAWISAPHLSSYGRRNLWVIIMSYITTMSFNAHKEFRYILPLQSLLCLLGGQHVRALLLGQGGSRLRFFVRTFLFVGANVLAVLYLGLFHQSGPITVNRRVLALSQRLDREKSNIRSVHYLTGACHSTPLLSHLHSPPLKFETWSLDCSPQCRADPDITCESDQCQRDPEGFVSRSYFTCDPVAIEEKETVCPADQSLREAPDFLVTMASLSERMKPKLLDLGLTEVARFPHHVTGVKVKDVKIGDGYADKSFRHFMILNWLDISLEEMVLFSKLGQPLHGDLSESRSNTE